MSVFEAWGGLIRDGWGRYRRSWGWVLGEYLGLAVLIALGLAWTRIPEKNGWQVVLTVGLPVVVMAGFLWLQAGLMRGFLPPAVGMEEEKEDEGEEAKWVPIAWGAATLLLSVAIGWVLWGLIDRLDDHIFSWAAYLNSKFGANARVRWASYANLLRDLQWAEWALRWVVVPGLLIPLGVCSAAWGVLRLRWRRALAVWTAWKWWPVVAAWALIGEAWPRTWFETSPHGTVQAQIWRVGLKLAVAYLLAVTGWIKVLGWGAMLVNPRPRSRMDEPVLTLGLRAPAKPLEIDPGEAEEVLRDPAPHLRVDQATSADVALEAKGAAGAAPEDGAPEPKLGRPLPRGGEDGGGNA